MYGDEDEVKFQKKLKRDKLFFYSVFLLSIAFFLSIFIYDVFFDKEPPFVDIETPTIEEDVSQLTRDVYWLGDKSELLSAAEIADEINLITISDASEINEPSFFLIDYKEMDPLFDRVYQELLDKKHAVIFLDIQLNPEDVVSFFSEDEIPVIPLEGTLPTYFQAYGAMYSALAEDEIPVFFATNETETFNANGFMRSLTSLEEHFSSTEKTTP